jgi:hypothetical protein
MIQRPERKKPVITKGLVVFLSGQAAGGSAVALQNLAIALVPFGYLAFVNALQGIQYALLFILTIVLSFAAPRFIKEKVTARAIRQKVIALILIGGGIALLAL